MSDQDSSESYKVASSELKSFVDRLERLQAESKEIADQVKEVKAECKSRGYDVKVVTRLLALRKRDPDDVAEEEALLDMYKEAIGMK